MLCTLSHSQLLACTYMLVLIVILTLNIYIYRHLSDAACNQRFQYLGVHARSGDKTREIRVIVRVSVQRCSTYLPAVFFFFFFSKLAIFAPSERVLCLNEVACLTGWAVLMFFSLCLFFMHSSGRCGVVGGRLVAVVWSLLSASFRTEFRCGALPCVARELLVLYYLLVYYIEV